MNKKGMAISSIIYVILILFILLIITIILMLGVRNMGLNKLKTEVKEELEGNVVDVATSYKDESGANQPKLTDKLIPITINPSNGQVTIVDGTTKWYDYNNKEWANAIILKNGESVSVGDVLIDDTKIAAYYVWIPRYEYQIFDTDGNSTDETDITAINSQGGIQIKFTDGGEAMPGTPSMGTYYTHPAFSYDNGDGTNTQIDGFWVGKFELTTNSTILPNIASQRNQTVSQFYNTIGAFETTYNLINIDSHMMKNMEWGATAYLSYSKYGTCTDVNCTEITTNTNSSFLTGGGDYVINMNQSTTGNVTGIYDMSGGAWDSVMGNNNNNSSGSGFETAFFTDSNNYKYLDKYNNLFSDINFSAGKYGDATKEVTKWNNDSAYFVNSSFPWFYRGDTLSAGSKTGIFSFTTNYYGDFVPSSLTGSRAVLWVQ